MIYNDKQMILNDRKMIFNLKQMINNKYSKEVSWRLLTHTIIFRQITSS